MKSIKPGRGPSGMSFVGSIIGIVFGIFWTVMAVSLTANSPFGGVAVIFPLFGVLFIIAGIASAVYSYKNATGKDRYSIVDIVDASEEGDPANKWIKDHEKQEKADMDNSESSDDDYQDNSDSESNFCPYCGAGLKSGYVFCRKCGKEIE